MKTFYIYFAFISLCAMFFGGCPCSHNHQMGVNNALVAHTVTRWDPANIGRNPANNQWLIDEVIANTPAQRPAFMVVYPLSWSYYPSDLQYVLNGLGPEYVPVTLRDFKILYEESQEP